MNSRSGVNVVALDKKFLVRMPSSLHETIAANAQTNRRSINSEIVFVLDAHYRQVAGRVHEQKG